MLYAFLLPAVVLALLFVPVVIAIKKKKGEKSIKKAFAANICSFFAVMLICAALPLGMKASAEAEANAAANTAVSEEAEEDGEADTSGLLYIASALAVGLGAIGGGIAIAAAAPAAIGAVSENPKNFSNALIFAALGEACALYGFVVALLMLFI